MDPNANLKELLQMANATIEDAHKEGGEWIPNQMYRMAELVIALDHWLKQGGALPDQWQSKR